MNRCCRHERVKINRLLKTKRFKVLKTVICNLFALLLCKFSIFASRHLHKFAFYVHENLNELSVEVNKMHWRRVLWSVSHTNCVHVYTLHRNTLKILQIQWSCDVLQSPDCDLKAWPPSPAVPSPPPPAGRSAVRRRQPEESPGEGEAGSLPHASLHPSRLSEPPARHDRSGRHQEAHGTTLMSPDGPAGRSRAEIFHRWTHFLQSGLSPVGALRLNLAEWFACSFCAPHAVFSSQAKEFCFGWE